MQSQVARLDRTLRLFSEITLKPIRRKICLIFSLSLAPLGLSAQPNLPGKEKSNFMVVVRETPGANRSEDSFRSTGKQRIKLQDGKEVELDFAHFEFIGDTHIRFVFDGPSMMANASRSDLNELGLLDVEAALKLAIANIHRVYGKPVSSPFQNGVFQVNGKSPDLDSSYFLDRDFWAELEKQNTEGLVVAVPKRGGLLYAPLKDQTAVQLLVRNVSNLHRTSERQRVSGALFQFKGGVWTVFRPSEIK